MIGKIKERRKRKGCRGKKKTRKKMYEEEKNLKRNKERK